MAQHDDEADGRATEIGAAIGAEVSARMAARLAQFEERMQHLETDLREEVGRVRSSVQVVDLLADEVRRTLSERPGDDIVLDKLAEVEVLVRSDLDALRRAGPDFASLTESIDDLRSRVEDGRPDLAYIEERLTAIDALVRAERQDTSVTSGIDAVHATVIEARADVDALSERLADLQTRVGPGLDLSSVEAGLRDLPPTSLTLGPISPPSPGESTTSSRPSPRVDPTSRRCTMPWPTSGTPSTTIAPI